jgi:hypothetical protein
VVEFELLPTRTQDPIKGAPYDRWLTPASEVVAMFYRTPLGYKVRFPDQADFEIANGGLRVTCEPSPDVPDTMIMDLYRNQILPLIASWKGKLVLHGSAVATNGYALAFLGQSGRGKSTLAAGFAVEGCPFLTDDGLVLEADGGAYLAMPSHPSLRLREDSRNSLLFSAAPAVLAVGTSTKRRVSAGPKLSHCDRPIPLRTIYFLRESASKGVAFQRLSPAKALYGLIQHSFILDVENRPAISAHFDRLTKLANWAACFHLDYPRCYKDLPRVMETIRAHQASQVRDQ